jgi:hypothetical protein
MNKIIKNAVIATLAAVTPIHAGSATIIETLSIQSSGFFYDQPFSGDNFADLIEGDNGFQRNGIALTSYVDGGNFFFHHNIYSQGGGFIEMFTRLTITLTNTGDTEALLRFDSLITPGHIALQGSNENNGALFNFTVTQNSGSGIVNLYQAYGNIQAFEGSSEFPLEGYVVTTNGDLKNMSNYSSEGRLGFDWDATPLNLALQPIGPGETHVISYENLTAAFSGGVCATLLGCEGTQVAFGDPRRDGSTSQRSGSASLDSTTESFIGRTFSSFSLATPEIVSVDAPLPDDPGIFHVVPDYASLPAVDAVAVGAVPEPASWLMLIIGFGLVGTMMRRRTFKPA